MSRKNLSIIILIALTISLSLKGMAFGEGILSDFKEGLEIVAFNVGKKSQLVMVSAGEISKETVKLFKEYFQWLREGILGIGDTVTKPFKPKVSVIEKIPLQIRKEMKSLEERIEKLEKRPSQIKEVEVSRITKIEPTKEIIKEKITEFIPSEELKEIKSKLAAVEEILKKIQAMPPGVVTPNSPVYIGTGGIQTSGIGIFQSISAKHIAGRTLGIGASATIGSNASDKLTVYGTSIFKAPVNIESDLTATGYIKGGTGICIDSDCKTSWSEIGGYWTLSDSNLYASSTSWNVGIGTNTPSEKLTVSGNILGTGNLIIQGISNLASTTINGSLTVNTNQLYIDPQTGNVGIGTTSPGAKLYISTADVTTVPFQVEALVGNFPSSYCESVYGSGVTSCYRKPVTISNSTSTLTDYQVSVTLNTQSLISAGKMRSDCGDIRFTDSDGQSLLNYWLESGCNTASTKIWVKVTEIPVNSIKTIYVYYGNSNATSQSNGDNTFIFFENFDPPKNWTLTGKWHNTEYGVNSPANGNVLRYGDVDTDSYDDQANSGEAISPSFNLPEGTVLFYLDKSATEYSDFEPNPDYDLELISISTDGGNTWTQLSLYSGTWDWTQRSIDISAYSGTNTKLKFSFDTVDDWFNDYYGWAIDQIIVRKYTSPEPTTSVGIEETLQLQQTVFYIQNQTGNVGIWTTAPVYKLDVAGSIRASGSSNVFGPEGGGRHVIINDIAGARWALGTGAYDLTFYKHKSDTDTWETAFIIHGDAAANVPQGFSFFAGGSERLTITSTGNVGIGTTIPSEKLTVAGNIGIQAGTNAFIGTLDNYALSLRTNNIDRVFITKDGNVSIGTTEPNARLYIKTAETTTVPFQVEAPVNVSFSYRKPITITNSSSENLTDYQVLVPLDTQSLISAGKMRPDCGDIRFTDSDGITQLNYWLESGCNTTSTKLWVKVPSIPPGSKTIYVYYGNPNATSQSNGDNTFIFFDDFLGSSVDSSKWQIATGTEPGKYGTCSISVSNSRVNLNTAGDGGWCELKSIQNYSFGLIAEFYAVMNTGGNELSRIGITNHGFESGGDFGDDGMIWWGYWAPGWGIYQKRFVTEKNASSTYIDISFDYGTWYRAKMFSTGQNAQLWLNDSLVANQTNSTYCPDPSEVGKIWINAHSYAPYLSPQVSVDWVRLRKYASPEPTTSVGAEETAPPLLPQQQTVFYIQNQTGNVGIGTTIPATKLQVDGRILNRDPILYSTIPLWNTHRLNPLKMQHRLSVAVGWFHTCILKSNGNVHCYGDDYYGQYYGQSADYTGGDAIGVAAGESHTCILKSNGNVHCYGYNYYGQSADYTGGDAIGVAAGMHHTCILKSNGNVHCYGRNDYGQSADYTGGDAIGVAAGGNHTCILKSNGNVDCYGENYYGQAQDYTGGDAIGVAAGYSSTCILKSNGNVDCYGNLSWDYTGGDAIGVAVGVAHICVLKSNGNVDCYGDNWYGQSADYTGGDAIGVAAGWFHTCVLKSNGNVDCYGNNGYGQAADYTGGDAKNPFNDLWRQEDYLWSLGATSSTSLSRDLYTLVGNVGIGTTTAAYKLTVNGDLYVSATSTLGSATSTPVIFGGYIQSHIIPFADNTYTLGAPNYRWANIYAATTTIGGTITIGSDTIQGSATTTIFVGSNQNQLVLTPDGKVGIGTSTPAYLLDIAGPIRLKPSTQPTPEEGVLYFDSSTSKFKFYQGGAWKELVALPTEGVATGSLLYFNGTEWAPTSTIKFTSQTTIEDADAQAAALMSKSDDEAATILGMFDDSFAAKVVNSSNLSIPKAASICDSSNISSAKIKAILDTGLLTDADKIAALLDGDSLTAADAASHVNSGIYTDALMASAFNSTYLASSKAASIIDNSNLSASKAASIIDNANLTVSKAASILENSNLSDSKFDAIWTNANLSDARRVTILKWVGPDLDGWSYGKPITITNTTSTLTDYQVRIDLTPSNFDYSHASSTLADLRFKDAVGNNRGNLLNYWIENVSTTATSTIWVKVPSIPASATKTIYVYYGNSNATSTSSGEDTFLFFDDFSSGNLNKWQQWGNGTYSISYDPTEGGRAKLAVYRCSNAHLTTSFTVNTNNMVSFDWWEATDGWCEYRGFDVLLNDVPQPVNSFGGCYRYYGSGHVDNIINVTTTPSTQTLKPWVYQSPPCGNPDHGWTYLWIDNVRVRNYVSPEPTTSVGAEYPADIAEYYPTEDLTIEPGDLVRIKAGFLENLSGILLNQNQITEKYLVEKTSQPYDPLMIGVVSTNPAMILGEKTEKSVPVALIGRVPVKVSTINGEIKVGDYITSSPIPGVGMKATKPGRVIGIALESYSGHPDQIGWVTVFLNPHFAFGSINSNGDFEALFSEIQNYSTSTEISSQSILDKFVSLIKAVLEKLGLFIENGIARLKELFAERVTTKEIQMIDKATGEIYCVWIENGEWKKEKGECGMLTSDVNTTDNQNGTSSNSGDNETPLPAFPTVSFASSSYSGIVGQEINFEVTVSGFATDTLTFNWDFGDGAKSTTQTQTTTHTYNTTGTYSVSVEVSDGTSTASATTSVTITSSASEFQNEENNQNNNQNNQDNQNNQSNQNTSEQSEQSGQ